MVAVIKGALRSRNAGDALVFTYGEAMLFEWEREWIIEGIIMRAWLARTEREPIEAVQDGLTTPVNVVN